MDSERAKQLISLSSPPIDQYMKELVNFFQSSEEKSPDMICYINIHSINRSGSHIKDAINAIKSEIENYNRKNFVTKNIGAPLITTKKFVALYKEIRKKTFIEKYEANKKPDKSTLL